MDDLLFIYNIEPQPVCMPMVPSLNKYEYHATLCFFLYKDFF